MDINSHENKLHGKPIDTPLFFDKVYGELIVLFGEAGVRCDSGSMERYSFSLSGKYVLPLAIVYPQKTDQLRQLLVLANKNGLQLYPISKGKNFGYGAAQGTHEGQIIVDLCLMNRVLELNEELGFVTLEPGVSQQELYDYLQQKGSGLQIDVTGAGRHPSVVGNVLERGFGHTDYGNRFDSILGMEVLLPDGKLMRTGFGDYPGVLKTTYRHGMGPSVDGLFTQSNFGIVTKLSLALQPRPAYFSMFVYFASKEEGLEPLVEAVRTLKSSGVLNSCVHIANKERLERPGATNKAGAWNVSISLSGPKAIAKARKKTIQTAFKKQKLRGKGIEVTDNRLKLLGLINKYVFTLSAYPSLKEAVNLKKGRPTESYVQELMGDLNINSGNMHLGKGQNCFKWISAVSTAEPKAVRKLVSLTKTALEAKGYGFRVTLTFISARALIMISEIQYPNTTEAIQKAEKDYNSIVKLLAENGYYAYRSGSGNYTAVVPKVFPLKTMLKRVKDALDPNGILAPGKYGV